MRAGHTEAGCDLARMAGLEPAAVICEIMNEDGTMARLPDLQAFAQAHGLKIGTIADLIEHRSRHETLIHRHGTRRLATPAGDFDAVVFRDHAGGVHLALTHGRWSADDVVPVRVHEPFTALDLLDAGGAGHSWPLLPALAALRAGPYGVAVLLNCGGGADDLLSQLSPPVDATAPASGPRRTLQQDLRTYGIGAQILRELGVARMQLLGSPRRMPSMAGYGLEVCGFVAADA
jgi:3,4-dihydroxy 2-butanone 4-phosphate synthase/GTP cyclohydrolase II